MVAFILPRRRLAVIPPDRCSELFSAPEQGKNAVFKEAVNIPEPGLLKNLQLIKERIRTIILF
jgi:hypothetical protein